MLGRLLYNFHCEGTLEENLPAYTTDSPDWRDGKVRVSRFYMDNVEGGYQTYNCPKTPTGEAALDRLSETTGYKRTIQKIAVARWVELNKFFEECEMNDNIRRGLRAMFPDALGKPDLSDAERQARDERRLAILANYK